jgi:hypothetical protein
MQLGAQMDGEVQYEASMKVTLFKIHQYRLFLKGDRLVVMSQNLVSIPKALGETYGDKAKQLDLSYNSIKYVVRYQ